VRTYKLIARLCPYRGAAVLLAPPSAAADYYEWEMRPDGKQPYYITRARGRFQAALKRGTELGDEGSILTLNIATRSWIHSATVQGKRNPT